MGPVAVPRELSSAPPSGLVFLWKPKFSFSIPPLLSPHTLVFLLCYPKQAFCMVPNCHLCIYTVTRVILMQTCKHTFSTKIFVTEANRDTIVGIQTEKYIPLSYALLIGYLNISEMPMSLGKTFCTCCNNWVDISLKGMVKCRNMTSGARDRWFSVCYLYLFGLALNSKIWKSAYISQIFSQISPGHNNK